MKSRTVLFILVALLGVRLFLAALTPVFDTSEARYAAISANMARSGDFLVPRFTYNDVYQSFDGKPPLLFQSAGIVCLILGCREISVRLPVLLATLVMLAFIWYATCRLSDRRRAWLAVWICSTSVALYSLSGLCMTDGFLTPCVALAYLAYALFLKTGERNWTLGVFLALGIGMLVKGPVSVALFVGPVVLDAIFNRRWRQFLTVRWFGGGLLFLAIGAPWFVMMERETPGFLKYFFINENLLRFLTRNYGDRYGAGREFFRGMALIWAVVVTLPWTPVVVWVDRAKRDIFFWGVVGITGFWCLTSRIPLAYLIPIVPLFAVWVATHVREQQLESLERAVPAAALTAMLVLAGTLLVGMGTSKNMLGAQAGYLRNRYSYEFYHDPADVAREAGLHREKGRAK